MLGKKTFSIKKDIECNICFKEKSKYKCPKCQIR